MIDFETRAERAGESARAEARRRLQGVEATAARRRGAREHAAGRRPLVALGAAAALGAAIVVVLGVFEPSPSPVIDPAHPSFEPAEPSAQNEVLPVPPVGEALAAYLDDGRPVFVSHPQDGDVVVLDAVDPRAPWGWQQLVAFCSSSGWFEDLRHGSRFNGWGEWTGGPSPSGLRMYPSDLSADAATVRVTGPPGAAPDREAHQEREQSPRGPSCGEEIDGRSAASPATVQHQPPAGAPSISGADVPSDRWVWAVLTIGGTPADPRVCEVDGRCSEHAPPVAGIEPGDDNTLLDRVPRPMLARKAPGGAVDVVLPATDEDAPHPGGIASRDREPLLRLPPPGQVHAASLPDLAPVFVVHEEGGDVLVLDAVAPTNPPSLVGWCPGSGLFIDRGGIRYTPSGEPVVGAVEGLARYPHELVEVGETQGVRVTGAAVAGRSGSGAVHSVPPVACDDVVAHRPDQRTFVHDNLHIGSAGERWAWVRMRIEKVDQEIYLCASSDQPCGQPGDPNVGATCVMEDEDDPDTMVCEPYRDPIVVTPGMEASEAPLLMLVRSEDNGRTVEVRLPMDGEAAPTDSGG